MLKRLAKEDAPMGNGKRIMEYWADVIPSANQESWFPPDIRHVGDPLQVLGDRIEVHKEAGEQQDRDGGDGPDKRGHLEAEDDQTG